MRRGGQVRDNIKNGEGQCEMKLGGKEVLRHIVWVQLWVKLEILDLF